MVHHIVSNPRTAPDTLPAGISRCFVHWGNSTKPHDMPPQRILFVTIAGRTSCLSILHANMPDHLLIVFNFIWCSGDPVNCMTFFFLSKPAERKVNSSLTVYIFTSCTLDCSVFRRSEYLTKCKKEQFFYHTVRLPCARSIRSRWTWGQRYMQEVEETALVSCCVGYWVAGERVFRTAAGSDERYLSDKIMNMYVFTVLSYFL